MKFFNFKKRCYHHWHPYAQLANHACGEGKRWEHVCCECGEHAVSQWKFSTLKRGVVSMTPYQDVMRQKFAVDKYWSRD